MKEKIVSIAVRLMREGGYNNLNFSVIANELSTTRANLHHHFTNKEGLAEAALQAYLDSEKLRLETVLMEQDGNLPAILSSFEHHLIEMARKRGKHSACIGSQLLRDNATPSKLKEMTARQFRSEAEAIHLQVKKHIAAHPNPHHTSSEALTFRIVSVMHGIDMMGLIEYDEDRLVSQIKGSMVALLD